jgi:CPA1 family monovalent cation:H+ antiporter
MLGYGLLISLVTIVVRFIWVFAGVHWQTIFKKKKKASHILPEVDQDPDTTWKNVLVVAWTGTRGVISLAAALALPLFLEDGTLFPKRHSIIFIAFVVIIVTLVVQGLTLPLLIKWLKIKPEDYTDAEEKELELYLASHTVHFIEQELQASLNHTETEELKNKYQSVITELTTELRRHKKALQANTEVTSVPTDPLQNAKTSISRYQRSLLLKMHKEGEFSDAAIRKVERKLDINELKLNKTISGEGL